MKIGEEGEVAEQDFSQAEHVEGFSWGAQQKQVICRSCGAQSIYDALETSGICPFCGSNQVLEEAVDTSMPPNGICPFEVTREAAVLKFKKWIKRRLFTPSAAKKQARPETMNGIYLPYWTFDSKTSTFYTARYGIDRVYRDSKATRAQRPWYRTSGTYERFIDDQLVCASARHDVKMLRGVEPYDTKASKHYRPEYLSGWPRALFAGLAGRMGDRKGIHKSDAGAGDSRQDKARVPCRPCGQTAHEHRI